MDLAVAGGNEEIIQILEQSKIKLRRSCILYVTIFHRINIFDWILEQLLDSVNMGLYYEHCLMNMFINEISWIETLNQQGAFDSSFGCGLVSLVKLFLFNFSLHVHSGLIRACLKGHVEIVKLLLSLPSIDVNKKRVLKWLLLFHSIL